MAIALVQTVATSGGSSVTATLSATGVNNLLVILTGNFFADVITSISDGSNTYQSAVTTNAGSNTEFEIWYGVLTSSVTSVTVNYNNSNTHGLYLREYSGLATASPLDQTAVGTGSGTSMATAATGNTTVANELVVAGATYASGGFSISAGSGYGNFVSQVVATYQLAAEDKIVSSTGSQTGTMTNGFGSPWTMGLATFKTASASTPTGWQHPVNQPLDNYTKQSIVMV